MHWENLSELLPATSLGTAVFRTRFPDSLSDCQALQTLLHADEHDRLQRFKVESSAIHYLQTRALLRIVITHYLGCSNMELIFHYSHQKKPRIENSNLKFNATHTEKWGGVAISTLGELGLDFEAHNSSRDLPAIARRHFSPAEQAAIEALALEERTAAFFDTWTAKEACVKASGEGITADLQGFTTQLGPNPTVDLPGTWSLFRLPMPPGTSAALAVRAVSAPPKLYEISLAHLLRSANSRY